MSDDRQEFMAWWADHFSGMCPGAVDNIEFAVNAAWEAWQAARAKPCPDSVQITKGCARFCAGLIEHVIEVDGMQDDSNYTGRLDELGQALSGDAKPCPQCEQWREDAERYRWLTSDALYHITLQTQPFGNCILSGPPNVLGLAIDNARRGGE